MPTRANDRETGAELDLAQALRELLVAHTKLWWIGFGSAMVAFVGLAPFAVLGFHTSTATTVVVLWSAIYGFLMSFTLPITFGVAADLIRMLRGRPLTFIPSMERSPSPDERKISRVRRWVLSATFWINPFMFASILAMRFLREREQARCVVPTETAPMVPMQVKVYEKMRTRTRSLEHMHV